MAYTVQYLILLNLLIKLNLEPKLKLGVKYEIYCTGMIACSNLLLLYHCSISFTHQLIAILRFEHILYQFQCCLYLYIYFCLFASSVSAFVYCHLLIGGLLLPPSVYYFSCKLKLYTSCNVVKELWQCLSELWLFVINTT